MLAMLVLSIAAIIGLTWFLNKYRKKNKDLLETRKNLHTAEEMLLKDAKIKEVKNRLEHIINTAPVAFAMTVDGTIVEVNDYMQKHVGMEIKQEILPFYSNPDQRTYLFEQAKKHKVLNETVSLTLSNGETHRFLANVSITEFEQKQAFLLWAVDIEDREKQKDELSYSKQKFKEIKERIQRIIQTAPVSYLMSMDGKILEINENMKKDIGLDIGDGVRQIYTDPNERDNLLDKLYIEKRLTNEIVRINMNNGESHRILANFVMTEYEKKQAIIVWTVDIENSEEQKDQLETARQSLQKTMDALPIPVSIVDDESQKLVYGNHSYLELFEYDSIEALYNRYVIDELTPMQGDGSDSKQLMDAIIHSSVPIKIEMQIRTQKSKQIDVLARTHPIDYYGKRSTVCIMTDLTAEKEWKLRAKWA